MLTSKRPTVKFRSRLITLLAKLSKTLEDHYLPSLGSSAGQAIYPMEHGHGSLHCWVKKITTEKCQL